MTDAKNSSFVYVTFIRTTQEKLWHALTDPVFMAPYWFGAHMECDWKVGSPWRIVYPDGRVMDTGELLEIDPPNRMVIKWRNEFMPDIKAEGYGRCTMTVEPANGVMKLTVTHTMDKPESKLINAVSGGWPRILSNLKSLLETGDVIMPTK